MKQFLTMSLESGNVLAMKQVEVTPKPGTKPGDVEYATEYYVDDIKVMTLTTKESEIVTVFGDKSLG